MTSPSCNISLGWDDNASAAAAGPADVARRVPAHCAALVVLLLTLHPRLASPANMFADMDDGAWDGLPDEELFELDINACGIAPVCAPTIPAGSAACSQLRSVKYRLRAQLADMLDISVYRAHRLLTVYKWDLNAAALAGAAALAETQPPSAPTFECVCVGCGDIVTVRSCSALRMHMRRTHKRA